MTKLGCVPLRAQKPTQEDGVKRAGIHFLLHLQQQRRFVLNVMKLHGAELSGISLLPEVTRRLLYREMRCKEECPIPRAYKATTQQLTLSCPHPLTSAPAPSSPKSLQGTFPATHSP